jgi:hypothetical protein
VAGKLHGLLCAAECGTKKSLARIRLEVSTTTTTIIPNQDS